MVIGLNLPLSTNVVSLYTGPCAEPCGFLVAVDDLAVEDMAGEDLAVDLAVNDLAVEDFADLVDSLPLVCVLGSFKCFLALEITSNNLIITPSRHVSGTWHMPS